VARDRLYYASLVGIAGSLLLVVCVWLAYPDAAAAITVWAGSLALSSCALALLTRERRIPRRWLPAAGTALLVGLSAVLLYSFIRTRSLAFTLLFVTVVLGAGAMQNSTRLLIGLLVATVGSWLVAGVALFGADFAPVATGLVFTAFIAILLHLFVTRYMAHMKLLRRRDLVHSEELAAALAAAQRELTERHRAEAERERLRAQLLDAQKLEAIGTLAGGVAHDMNNVLAAILGLAEQTLVDPGTARQGAEQTIEAARRGIELSRNLLGFSRRGKYRKERLDLSSLVAGITALLTRTLPKEIEVVTSSAATHAIEGDIAQLGQALLNLCLNASDAMKGRGVLRIDVGEVVLDEEGARTLDLRSGRYARLVVSDTGCGMDQATRSRMFEPFFTTKEAGRGTGLGLSMVYGTIANHGGAIAVESEPGRGTSIALHLPAVGDGDRSGRACPPVSPDVPAPPIDAAPAAPVAEPAVVPTPARRPAAGGVVLVVDDEPLIRSVTRRSLERAGYEVIAACDGAEGVARFQERAADICVVLLDMAMPVMGGAECFGHLRVLDPSARVVLASGYALEGDARACLTAGALGFLEKPFTTARLLAAIERARSGQRLDDPFSLPAIS
jgi:signal transduction histidine kinase/ActR/RegA family two-component response regulator